MIKEEDGTIAEYMARIVNCYINKQSRVEITLENGIKLYGAILYRCDSGMLEMQTEYGKSYFNLSNIVSLTELNC